MADGFILFCVPQWVSWLRDFDILIIIYDKLKIEKMAKFEILIATNGLIKAKHYFEDTEGQHEIQSQLNINNQHNARCN